MRERERERERETHREKEREREKDLFPHVGLRVSSTEGKGKQVTSLGTREHNEKTRVILIIVVV